MKKPSEEKGEILAYIGMNSRPIYDTPPQEETKSWEKEFDEFYEKTKMYGFLDDEFPLPKNIKEDKKNYKQFKQFISSLLKSEREKTKQQLIEKIGGKKPEWQHPESNCDCAGCFGYRTAIKDITNIIKEN
jgi:hypothetical protein